jgi:repressor LexA
MTMTNYATQARPASPTGNPRPNGRPGRKPKGSRPVVIPETPGKPDPDHVLTWRQRKILRTIRESVQLRGYPPSMLEIGAAVGLTSTSSVSYQLRTLQRKGYLHREVGGARTMEVRLPGRPPVRPAGSVAGRTRDEAEPADLPGMDIPSQEAEGTLFLVKAVGDSMINAAIADGDWVVVRRQEDARDGDIVAAMLDGEATVKTIKRSDGHTWLIPHHPAYTPILGDEARVVGQVVAVLRRV